MWSTEWSMSLEDRGNDKCTRMSDELAWPPMNHLQGLALALDPPTGLSGRQAVHAAEMHKLKFQLWMSAITLGHPSHEDSDPAWPSSEFSVLKTSFSLKKCIFQKCIEHSNEQNIFLNICNANNTDYKTKVSTTPRFSCNTVMNIDLLLLR